MIAIDLSQILMGSGINILRNSGKYNVDENEQDENHHNNEFTTILRHILITQLINYSAMREKYGEIVISCDGSDYWRKKVFEYYKSQRKKQRAKNEIDWKTLFDAINTITEEIKENMMWKVVEVKHAESDDVIATLIEYNVKNNKDEKNLIVSSDQDFVQLQKYENVDQINPITKKLIKTNDAKAMLEEKVIRGDKGDGIPSVINDDDTYYNENKKTIPLTRKRFEALYNNGFEKCIDERIKRNWKRNKVLIDFTYIPKVIKQQIIEAYKKPANGSKTKIFNYLLNNADAFLKDENSINALIPLQNIVQKPTAINELFAE